MAFDPASMQFNTIPQDSNILQEMSKSIKNYLGHSDQVLTTRPDGTDLQDGDVYFNTKFGEYYIRINGKWKNLDTNFLIDENGKLKTIDGKELTIENADKLENKSLDEVVKYTKSNILPVGNKNQTAFIKEDGSNDFYYDDMVKTGKFALNDEQLQLYLNATISQEEVFNSWYRFSHDGSDNFPANADETKAWVLNDDGTISCTENTNTYVGFISNNTYDYYDLEVTLSSTNSDNDRMGVVLAFYKDTETGKEYTIDAIRNNDNTNYSWMVIRNFMVNNNHSNAWDFTKCDIVENKTDVITRADPDGWSNYSPGTVIKVQRRGNNFKVWSSQAGSDTIDEDSLIEFNLDDDPAFDVFKGPKAYGFSALSQDDTTFSNIKFQDTNPNSISQYIFDTNTQDVYELNDDGTYDKIENKLPNILSSNKFYKDTKTKQMFYFDGVNFDFINGNQYIWNQVGLSENGYIKLPNGLIIQWGYVALSDTSDTVNIYTINFPITFPNKVFNIQVTSREGTGFDNSGQEFYALTVSSTKMTNESFDVRILDNSGSSGDVGINYIAIGY